jgi:hypothetical protein
MEPTINQEPTGSRSKASTATFDKEDMEGVRAMVNMMNEATADGWTQKKLDEASKAKNSMSTVCKTEADTDATWSGEEPCRDRGARSQTAETYQQTADAR